MAKYAGTGVTLATEIASVYTVIAQIRDINGPNQSADTIETTSRDNANLFKTYLAGLRDGGEVSFDLLYDPDLVTHSASAAGGLVKLLQDGTLNNFRISFPDAAPVTTVTFSGIVTAFTPKSPMNDALAADCTIKVSARPTWA
jgi:hypothetical protein